MKKQSSLKVKALKKYPKPRYPGYADPNPLLEKGAPAFPFSIQLQKWAAAAGLFTLISPLAAQQADEVPAYDGVAFSFEHLGIPYTPISFGTGLPERLSEKSVRAAVQKAFLAEGLHWDSTHVWREGEQEVILDGYDAETKIGFFYANYARLGEGTARRHGGMLNRRNAPLMGEGDWWASEKASFREHVGKQRNQSWMFNRLKRKYHSETAMLDKYTGLLEQLLAGEELKERDYEDLVIAFTLCHDLSDHAAGLLRGALELEFGDERDELLRQFQLLKGQRQTHFLDPTEDLSSSLGFRMQNLANEMAKKTYYLDGNPRRWVILNSGVEMIEFLNWSSHLNRLTEVEIAVSEAEAGDWESMAQLERLRKQITADLPELAAMLERKSAAEDQVFVIGNFNQQTIVPRLSSPYHIPPDQMPPLPEGKKRADLSEEERLVYNQQVRENMREYVVAQQEISKEEQLKKLEIQVRSFIRWAKETGRY